jgi:hypothetical protein
MKDIVQFLNESQDKDFTRNEINEIKKDMKAKDGFFIQFMHDKVDHINHDEIDDYLYNQCLNDDRCTAEFAAYISEIIQRQNFSLEQVMNFIDKNELI